MYSGVPNDEEARQYRRLCEAVGLRVGQRPVAEVCRLAADRIADLREFGLRRETTRLEIHRLLSGNDKKAAEPPKEEAAAIDYNVPPLAAVTGVVRLRNGEEVPVQREGAIGGELLRETDVEYPRGWYLSGARRLHGRDEEDIIAQVSVGPTGDLPSAGPDPAAPPASYTAEGAMAALYRPWTATEARETLLIDVRRAIRGRMKLGLDPDHHLPHVEAGLSLLVESRWGDTSIDREHLRVLFRRAESLAWLDFESDERRFPFESEYRALRAAADVLGETLPGWILEHAKKEGLA